MNNLEISRAFTVEDIRKIRDYNYEITKGMNHAKVREYYKQAADTVSAEIERIRKTLHTNRPMPA